MRAPKVVVRSLAVVIAISCGACVAPSALARTGFVRATPKHKFGRGTSTNWSGYAVGGSNATQVAGVWTQPSVADNCASAANSWSSPWVGIDGDTSNTVEQIGTDSDCQSGRPVYYAWYEMYPKSLVVISSITVTPGHSYQGSVTYSSGIFTLTLQDLKTGAVFSTNQSRKASRSSVEWIMEGPSSGSLTDFGSVSFSGASATIGGRSGQLDPTVFPNADPITMVTSHGTPRAIPSSPPAGGTFSVNWEHT
jgi:hypothetical protein